MIMNCKERGGK